MANRSFILVMAFILSSSLYGQQPTSATLPDAPAPAPAWKPDASQSYFQRIGILCGSGASTSSVATKPTAGCGVGMRLPPLPLFLEVGVMAPQANRSYLTGYFSADTDIALIRNRKPPTLMPMAIFGYSRLFETGNSLDYGIALAMPRFPKTKDPTESMRIELRDYCTFANPTQHNIMLRIGWMQELED